MLGETKEETRKDEGDDSNSFPRREEERKYKSEKGPGPLSLVKKSFFFESLTVCFDF